MPSSANKARESELAVPKVRRTEQSSARKRPKAVAWELHAWLVARGETPLRVILRSDLESVASMMLRMDPSEQIYPVKVVPLNRTRPKARAAGGKK